MRVLFVNVLVIQLLLISCDNSTISKNSGNQFLIKSKSVKFPLDEVSTYEFFIYQSVGDSLLVLNQVNYSLDIYSLSEQSLIGRINIDREGVNGIERLNTFYYHNQDSIFLFSQFILKNSLIVNVEGNIIDRIRHNEFNSDVDGLINHVGTPSMPNIIFENELHFSVFQLTNESIENDYFIHEHSLDLESGNFKSYPYVKKPSFMNNQRWIDETFSRIKIDKEEWYFSWNLSDTVYHIIGENGVLIESKAIPMNGGIGTNPKPVPKENYDGKWLEMSLEGYVYGKILLDRNKNIIHRLRYVPTVNPNSPKNYSNNPYLIKNFEILSYRLDGEFLGTTRINSRTYDPRLLFLGPKGIYIPRIHPNYDGLQEDEIVYDVFSVE